MFYSYYLLEILLTSFKHLRLKTISSRHETKLKTNEPFNKLNCLYSSRFVASRNVTLTKQIVFCASFKYGVDVNSPFRFEEIK